MIYKYDIKYDSYDAVNNKFITKVELGDSAEYANNERIKGIINESNATVDKREWQSKYNKHVIYDYEPFGGDKSFIARYTLSFNNEYQKNYFFHLLDKYYFDVNCCEATYKLEPCIQAGSKEDR